MIAVSTWKTTVLALAILWTTSPRLRAADDYQLGPDSMPHDGVPKGKVVQGKHTSDKVFAGAVRDDWVYTPAQDDGSAPAAVMVFQDGGSYVNNLTHKHGGAILPDSRRWLWRKG